MRPGCPRGGGGGRYVGMRRFHPTRGPIGTGCGNTLRESHTPPAKKMYVLCYNTYDYVFDEYLYTGRRSRICQMSTCTGNLDAKGTVPLACRRAVAPRPSRRGAFCCVLTMSTTAG